MRQPLDKALRKKLEETVIKGRDIVEVAVNEALQRLGVADSKMPSYLNEPEREPERQLRNKLRAHARQLGDALQDGKQQIERLSNEMAYEHWHRMLFACYLEQNNLLMYDQNTAVTIEECAELAEEESDCKDGWELAGRLAQKMLPQIFRVDSPVFEVKLSINHVNELEGLISKLDPATYQAQDSLGWCYQFWQTKKKDQVNKSGVKIGAQELSPVTQLFTEPYMVSFLLDNALGAWWANKHLTQDDLIRANNEQELRELAAIPGVPLEFLRFSRQKVQGEESEGAQGQWKPAAGGFEQWPDHLSELKTLDPCCGSGHFLVAVFLMLVPMRMQLEGLTEKEAVDAVLRENIHGLELDQRCVELAAFALALEAWRYPNTGGYRVLPELQLACSGMSITEAQKECKELAKDDQELQGAIKWMQETFKNSTTLGSLIEPDLNLKKGEARPWELIQKAVAFTSDASTEAIATAQGLAKAAGLLSNKFQWVVTNVPYLARNKMILSLGKFCEETYPNAKNDLANVFLERGLKLLDVGGLANYVMTQNWMFLSSYKKQRLSLLSERGFSYAVKLGGGAEAFDYGPGNITNIALVGINKCKRADTNFFCLDVQPCKTPLKKSFGLKNSLLFVTSNLDQLNTPDSRIVFEKTSTDALMETNVDFGKGSTTGDAPRFLVNYWEKVGITSDNTKWLNSPVNGEIWSGRNKICTVQITDNNLTSQLGCWLRGQAVWNRKGIAVNKMTFEPLFYDGEVFDDNICPLVPEDEKHLKAVFCYVTSKTYHDNVRIIDQKINVTAATLTKVPFDLKYWSEVANEELPNGLSLPYTDDSTQWIFHGHPCASVAWDTQIKTTAVGQLRQDDSVLQVTVARLLGYQWPAEQDAEMELAPEMRQVMKKNADFAGLVDDDGIVCIPAVRGEKTATKRLEAILYKAYGEEWTSSVEANLLKAVKANDLDSWLRDKFFDQHCKLFQHRPFIWQIWDGLKDGFSALVNYHKLDYKGLERLIYTYLDDWIGIQKRDLADGKDGADIRLTAAENLKVQLEAILQGEKGLDIFVRWKPLAEQPIGWNPDLNDGVRLNIRPFMNAKDVGKKGAGVLRDKPNIHWNKDRGTDVESAPWFDLGLEYGGKQGDRINDHHLTLAEKKAAREAENE